MEGRLFIYYPEKRLPCFCSGNKTNRKHLIFIPGLTDTFLSNKYLPLLANLSSLWNVVQLFTSSSHIGYGTSSLQSDCEELDKLVDFLVGEWECDKIVLLGFSTGAQDCIAYLKCGRHANKINGVIFQGPVSDRDFMMTQPNTQYYKQLAKEMIDSGKADELMPREAEKNAPITAYRYNSLAGRLTHDDMFSSDLTVAELTTIMGHVKVPNLWVFSVEDEYVPKTVDVEALSKRFAQAVGRAPHKTVFLKGANHYIDKDNPTLEFVGHVLEFLASI